MAAKTLRPTVPKRPTYTPVPTADCAKLPDLKMEIRDENGNFVDVANVPDPRVIFAEVYREYHPDRTVRAIVGYTPNVATSPKPAPTGKDGGA